MRPMHAVAHTNAFKPTLYVHTRSAQLRCCARRPPHVHSEQHQAPLWHDPHEGMARASVAAVAAVCALAQLIAPIDAVAAQRTKQPPVSREAGRCDVTALDNFAETRAKFSQEASGGNMAEAVVDVRDCDFSGMDLSGKVFSGVLLRGANLTDAKVIGSQFARADAQGAKMDNLDATDANCYSTSFDGASLQGAQFENAILTAASFGKSPVTGEWADLAGAHFEGALLSSSDVERICQNPTLDLETKQYELGCRSTK